MNFTGVIDIYRKELTELIAQDPNHTTICSPKLDIAEKWIDFKKILSIENSAGFALALYSILLDQKKELLSSKITTIFIDHSQQYKLAEELARLIGLPPNKIVNLSEDIDVNLPRRTKLFNEVDKVLILTTIISSSETARRLVKQVLRDKATPISVITLLNINKESINSIRTWKNFTDVYSLNKPREKSNSEIKLEYDDKFKIVTDKLYINLNSSAEINVYSPTYEIEKESDKGFKLPQDLSDLFDRTKSLHYDHFGKYNDRHYTFFLNKKNILRDGEIKDSLKEEIFKWTQVNNIDQFTFIVPDKNFDTLKKVISGFGFNQVEVLLLKEVNNENYYTPENAVFLILEPLQVQLLILF